GYMPDGCAAGRAGETSVGDQGHILVQFHTGQRAGRIEHLPHARTAFWPFVADDDDIALDDLAVVDRIDRLLFTVKDTGRTGVLQHGRIDRAAFDDTAFWRDVAKEDRN